MSLTSVFDGISESLLSISCSNLLKCSRSHRGASTSISTSTSTSTSTSFSLVGGIYLLTKVIDMLGSLKTLFRFVVGVVNSHYANLPLVLSLSVCLTEMTKNSNRFNHLKNM